MRGTRPTTLHLDIYFYPLGNLLYTFKLSLFYVIEVPKMTPFRYNNASPNACNSRVVECLSQ